jgi:hypothetical protein
MDTNGKFVQPAFVSFVFPGWSNIDFFTDSEF